MGTSIYSMKMTAFPNDKEYENAHFDEKNNKK